MTWLIGIGMVMGALVAVYLGLFAYGVRQWADTAQELTRRLDAARMAANAPL